MLAGAVFDNFYVVGIILISVSTWCSELYKNKNHIYFTFIDELNKYRY